MVMAVLPHEAGPASRCVSAASSSAQFDALLPSPRETTALSDRDDITRLKEAVVSGDVQQVHTLLETKIDVNQFHSSGLSCLHFAALHNQVDVVRVLLHFGANTLAVTQDENKITPGMLAAMENYEEVLQVLCDHPAVINPYRRRFLGPCVILVIIAVNTVGFFHILSFDLATDLLAEEDALRVGELDTRVCYLIKAGLSSLLVCCVCLALTNALDPGTVERSEVGFVDDLYLKEQSEGKTRVELFKHPRSLENFRWCRSCELWKPMHVSHCSECKRCFWRFDHHCAAVGNCVANRNHRFFALTILSGAVAWTSGSVALVIHGGVLAVPRSLQHVIYDMQWEMHLLIAYVACGFLGSGFLLIFGSFHVGSLIFNINTKMLLRPRPETPSRWLNTREELYSLFCMRLKWRDFGAPTSIRPRCMNSY
eukprot:TRINITY_DN27122_c0_g1_i1.p1 TRINITY_DN27122_c0_g1~~TRINITY_DN27122_c0_g1_i1.p1  ORF type:complete len:425 (+),score=39.07 TRINITY_DN27122_c0_g1_i1:211-1485(+)